VNAPTQPRQPARMRAHLDEVWALELSELAHDIEARVDPGPRPETGLIKYIHRLREHYHEHTPTDLPEHALHKHGKYLSHRYRGILSHLHHLITPKLSRHPRLQNWLHEHPDAELYYHMTERWHEEIEHELRDAIHYWNWVRQHEKLPTGLLHPRLSPFNDRPIAHPWQTISECAMEAMGTLEYELRL